MSREVVILSAARTPVGRYLGTLADIPASRLGAIAMTEALKRAGVEPNEIEEVIMGNVLQAGQGQNPARKAALIAGIPQDIHAWTLNMVCASGAKAVHVAANTIKAGAAEVVLAGGMENMSLAPVPGPQSPHRLPHG